MSLVFFGFSHRFLNIFSDSIAKLFNEFQVTGRDAATKDFVEVRDNTRKQAVVYKEKVLPSTETAMKRIATYIEIYIALTFEQWKDSLDPIMKALREAEIVCEFLRDLHKDIITQLEKNKSQATIGVEQLKKMKTQYQQERDKLVIQADEAAASAESAKSWGKNLVPVTFGISALVGSAIADNHETKREQHLCNAAARDENANIAAKAAALTTTDLIPAIESFIKCLEVFLKFVNLSKTKIERMRDEGDNGAQKLFYLTMQKKANDISGLCDNFVSLTDCMRTKMAALPKDPSDKNYVDKWLEEQLKNFQQKSGHMNFMATLHNFLKSVKK